MLKQLIKKWLKDEEEINVLLRTILGSIEKQDNDFFQKLEDADRREFCQSVSAVWYRIKPALESYIEKQKDFIVTKATNEQITFAKGTINGIFLLYEFFENCHNEHKANVMPKEQFNPYNQLPE